PAAFNTDLTRRGGTVTSIDPLYALRGSQIQCLINETYESVLAQMYRNQSDYLWDTIGSVEELGSLRMSAMEKFLSDYDSGKAEDRYIAGGLPLLQFDNNSFDIALCSHFLFLYSSCLSEEFHLMALMQMLRVSNEVRVFPLINFDGRKSPYLGFVLSALKRYG
ncbi:MAG: SAM-dependent methyltransferase, partial [Nitrospirae bacterium]|nr:SAM-dependent methyltransferase [Nitrospirota bacterium]